MGLWHGFVQQGKNFLKAGRGPDIYCAARGPYQATSRSTTAP